MTGGMGDGGDITDGNIQENCLYKLHIHIVAVVLSLVYLKNWPRNNQKSFCLNFRIELTAKPSAIAVVPQGQRLVNGIEYQWSQRDCQSWCKGQAACQLSNTNGLSETVSTASRDLSMVPSTLVVSTRLSVLLPGELSKVPRIPHGLSETISAAAGPEDLSKVLGYNDTSNGIAHSWAQLLLIR